MKQKPIHMLGHAMNSYEFQKNTQIFNVQKVEQSRKWQSNRAKKREKHENLIKLLIQRLK